MDLSSDLRLLCRVRHLYLGAQGHRTLVLV